MDASAIARSLDNLENSWSSLDWWLNFWTILVVVGVAVELAVITAEYVHDWHEFRRATIHCPEKPRLLVFCLGLLGAALVAIGVAGEFGVHVRAQKVEIDMRSRSRELVALANKDAKEAVDHAAAANERAAGANREAGAANERTAMLERENLELKKQLSPRRVTQQQREQLKRLLGKYKGIEILSSRGVNGIGEAPQFREQLFQAFEYAGLKARGGSNLPYSEMTGIHIEAFGDLGRFADDLRSALIKVGLATPASIYVTKHPSLGNGQDRIDIAVLEKP